MGKKKAEEAEANNGMQFYYFTTAIIFALLSVYCFMYTNNYGDSTCVKNEINPVAVARAKKKAEADAAAEADKAPAPAAKPKEEAAGAGLLRRMLEFQINELSYSRELEWYLEEQQRKEEQMLTNGTILDKLLVYKNKVARTYQKGMKKMLLPRGRRLDHLSPTELGALGKLSARMNKDPDDDNVYNLSEGTSQVANAFGMFICYAIQAGLSFIIGSGMACFGVYLPTEIPELNCCFRCYGGIVRKLMSLQIKLHYVTMVQVLILWYGSLQDSCVYNGNFAVLSEGGNLALSKAAGEDAAMMLQVTGTMWFLMHCVGGIIRSVVYIEPLYQIPDDPDDNEISVVLCQKCGP